MGGWTKADVTRLREELRGRGSGIDEIADRVQALCGGSRLAAYRMAHGLSQPEVVDRFLAATDGAFLDQPTLSRLEQFPARRSRSPLAAHLVPLAAIYGTTPLRLLSQEALERIDAREQDVLLRWGGTLGAARAHSGVAPPDRVHRPLVPRPVRPGPARPSTRSLEGEVTMAARRALRFAATVEGSNVGPETMADLHDEVERLATAYPQQPLSSFLGDLVCVQDVAFGLLEGRQRPGQTRDLYTLAGIASGMLAKASHDLGDPQAAMTQTRAAFVCADAAAHDGLRTWVRGLQSLISYWAGRPNDALRYARLGAEPASRTAGSAKVWIASLEARAWARFGDAEQTSSALQRADDERDRVQRDDLDEMGGILAFPHQRQMYYAADALAWLPEQRASAESRAQAAVTAYERAEAAVRSFGDEAGARTDLAVARIRGGDVEGARDALAPVLQLPVSQRINGIVASVDRVHASARGAASSGSGAAREMQEEIEAFTRSTARVISR